MTDNDLLERALALPPDARAEFLKDHCAGDEKLLARLGAVLFDPDHTSGAEPRVNTPTAAYHSLTNEPPAALTAGMIVAGRFKLLECVGEGGMGTVYVAEQLAPIRRKVALKVIKAGMDSRSVVARFDAERQALALMDHPNIARVFDGGLTEQQRPFFAMEYIKGVPITQFCDRAKLSIPERLQLFIAVCQGVQHAHQKGIIHRDLKPSNILVGLYDDQPAPKVIDFGLAKAMYRPLTDHSLHTAVDIVMGTPLYMSPEQSELHNLDLDTRTDIYSLGVILYELLTGSTPLDRNRLEQAPHYEVLQMIRNEEATRPSTKIASSAELPRIAANRQTDPTKLPKMIRGDLDWIVMKALEKDRARRYETANGLASDLKRFLADEPVEACPPSAGYRVRKFLRKHRTGVFTAAAVMALIVVGAGISIWQAIRATRAEHAAVAIAEAEREANALATKRLEQLERTNVILGSIFRDLDPRLEEQGGTPLRVQLGQRLDQASATLDGEAVGNPLSVARLQTTLGITQRRLGDPKKAIDLLTKVVATRERELGPNHADTLEAVHELADSYRANGEVAAALPLFERAFAGRKATLGPEAPDTLISMGLLAADYAEVGQRGKALPMLEQALDLQRRVLGPDNRDTLSTANDLAMAQWAAGKVGDATHTLEHVVDRCRAVYGPDHRDTLAASTGLARLYIDGDRASQGLELYEKTLERMRKTMGSEHVDTLKCEAGLALAYQQMGQLDKAMPLQERLVEKSSAKFGEMNANTLANMNNLAITYENSGALEKAIRLYDETARRSEKALGLDNPDTLDSLCALASCYGANKQYDQAIATYNRALPRFQKMLGPSARESLRTMDALGYFELKAGYFDRAEPVLRESLRLREKDSPDAWSTSYTKCLLGRALDGQKRFGEAEPFLLSGTRALHERSSTLSRKAKVRFRETMQWLVEHYGSAGKPDEAAKWQKVLDALPEIK